MNEYRFKNLSYDSNIYITNLGSIRINEEAKLRIKDF